MIPFITYELDKIYRLRFGMQTQIEFEQLTGVNIGELEDRSLTATEAARMIFCMMRADGNKDLTFDEAMRIIDDNAESMQQVNEKVSEAIQAAYSTGKKVKNAKAV